jgi:hypothetical protein
MMKTVSITPSHQKLANIIARKNGFYRATKVILGNENKVVSHTPCGYRKHSNGEYVTIKYRMSMGARMSFYYQHAETVVEIKA